jgi:hypothetical protein
LCVDREGVEAVKSEMNVDPKQSRVLSKCALLSCVHYAIFYVHISEHDEQNILKLEWVLFHLKHNV